MFRFTIHDVLGLMVVVGLIVDWFLDHLQLVRSEKSALDLWIGANESSQERELTLKRDMNALRDENILLKKALAETK